MAGFDDADFDEPQAPKARPGKATHKAPDATRAATGAKTAQVGLVATEADKVELAELVTDKPIEVLTNEEKRNELYAKLRGMVAEQKPDLSTQAGRDRVKSFVYKLVRTRTALDAAGKDSNAGLRAQINEVDQLRRDMEAAMKKIEIEARKPLTDWEAAEELRIEATADARSLVEKAGIVQDWFTSEALTARIVGLQDFERPEHIADDDWKEIDQSRTETIERLQAVLERVVAAEETEAENRRLREELAELRAGKGAPDPAPASAEPVIEEQGELPPVLGDQRSAPQSNGGGAPSGGSGGAALTPTQQARRLVLPALETFGITGDQAKKLILGIEAGELPGITATYI